MSGLEPVCGRCPFSRDIIKIAKYLCSATGKTTRLKPAFNVRHRHPCCRASIPNIPAAWRERSDQHFASRHLRRCSYSRVFIKIVEHFQEQRFKKSAQFALPSTLMCRCLHTQYSATRRRPTAAAAGSRGGQPAYLHAECGSGGGGRGLPSAGLPTTTMRPTPEFILQMQHVNCQAAYMTSN